MPVATDKIAVVIPTIGRVDDLRRMLESLLRQSRSPDQVVIVDEAGEGRLLAGEFPELPISVSTLPRGSAAAKRNHGVECVALEIELIAFMDDDIVLEPKCIEAMMNFWKNAPEDVGGASYNWVNQPPVFAAYLKAARWVSRLGLYDSRGGLVTRSGFQTLTGNIRETCYVQWLTSCAVVYSRGVLREHSFDEWFQGYSYLEDLDFSYSLGKKYKLAVVADARFHHYPSRVGRSDSYSFGKMEIANRLHFVRKYPELSLIRCFLALVIRFLISLFLGLTKLEGAYFKRAWGNIVGLLQCCLVGEDGRAPRL